MDKSWKKLFEQKIRTRGKEYAYYYVSDYVANENGYSATVNGSDKYKVYVSIDYKNMSCSCPYAKDGKYCKHMAAVLYYAELLEKQQKEAERKVQEKAERQKLRKSIEEEIEKFGVDCRRTLLYDIQTVTEWKKEVNSLIREFKNKDGYIGYWEADSFIANLLDCFKTLYKYVSVCADKKAIDASMWLYARIHDIGVDDSSTGCMGYFEDEILELWEELAEYSDNNKELFKLALTNCEHHYSARDEMLDKLSKA